MIEMCGNARRVGRNPIRGTPGDADNRFVGSSLASMAHIPQFRRHEANVCIWDSGAIGLTVERETDIENSARRTVSIPVMIPWNQGGVKPTRLRDR